MAKKKEVNPRAEVKIKKVESLIHMLNEQKDERSPTMEVVGKCSACKGNVVERTSWGIPPGVSPIFGPGSRNQMRRHIDIYCTECGIMYSFAPPKKRKTKKRSK